MDRALGQKIGKIRYHDFQNQQFLTLDGIFEAFRKALICLGVFRFEIGALRKKLDMLGQINKFRDPNNSAESYESGFFVGAPSISQFKGLGMK